MKREEFPERRGAATILCVDDDPLELKALVRSLSRRGYRVHTCDSAPKALEAMERLHPALAIVDVMMPGMDGLELTEKIAHGSRGPIPVVLLTGLGTDETFYEGFNRGARYLLQKPCEPERVLNVVDYFVGDLGEEERLALKKKL